AKGSERTEESKATDDARARGTDALRERVLLDSARARQLRKRRKLLIGAATHRLLNEVGRGLLVAVCAAVVEVEQIDIGRRHAEYIGPYQSHTHRWPRAPIEYSYKLHVGFGNLRGSNRVHIDHLPQLRSNRLPIVCRRSVRSCSARRRDCASEDRNKN